MRIAIPLLGFGRAGGYRVLSRLASLWSDGGHDVVIVTHRTGPQPYFPVSSRVLWIDDRGRQSKWVGPRSHRPLVPKYRAVSQLFALSRALSRYVGEFDVILANHSLTAYPVRWCRTRGQRFYYVQAYEPEYYAMQSGWSSLVLSRLSALSYRLRLRQIVNSRLYCDYRGIRSAHVVPPGVDDALFHPANGHSDRDSDKFVIGCIGRTEVWKGTRSMVDAFRILSASDSRCVLRVAYGNLPESCRNLPGVEVVVPQNDAELADYYRSLDVLAAPGTVQLGAPHYPVMEAMACGIPVVTTGYFPATEANALIVPVGDPQSIADAVRQIMSQPALARHRASLGLEAMKSVTWPAVAASMLSIFQESSRAA